jgi:hypothetical protein
VWDTGTVTLGSGGLVDAGQVELVPGSALAATSAAAVSGTVVNNSTVHGPGGSDLLVFHDDVSGTGSFTGNVCIEGTYSPGASPEATSFETLVLVPSSELFLEVYGTTPGTEHDFLDISGDLTLDGRLRVWFDTAFSRPVPTVSIPLISASGVITGQFANAAPGETITSSDGLLAFTVNYTPGEAGEVVLSDFEAAPEPATLALMGLGAAALARRRRRQRR